MPGKFNFTIFGGLDKQFYTRFRALREKYKLDDRAMIECMVWHLLKIGEYPAVFPINFDDTVEEYKVTAPVDITLPEVV